MPVNDFRTGYENRSIFSCSQWGIMRKKKIKNNNDNLMLMFSLSSCSNFLCQRDIEYFVYFKEKLMPTKKRYLLHFLKRIFNHFGVYCTDIFCIELVEIGSLFCWFKNSLFLHKFFIPIEKDKSCQFLVNREIILATQASLCTIQILLISSVI